jgi:hypothetical protein
VSEFSLRTYLRIFHLRLELSGGHTHPEKAFEKHYGHNPLMMKDPENRERITATPSGHIFNSEGPLDYRQALWKTTPALLVTRKSVTIYSADGIGGRGVR